MIGVFKKILVSGAVISTCLSGCCVWGMLEQNCDPSTFVNKMKQVGGYKQVYGQNATAKSSANVSVKGQCKLTFTKNSINVEVKPENDVNLLEKNGQDIIVFKNAVRIATISSSVAGTVTVTLKKRNSKFENGEYHGLIVENFGKSKSFKLCSDDAAGDVTVSPGKDATVLAYVSNEKNNENPVAQNTRLDTFLSNIGATIAGEHDLGCEYQIDVALK